MRTLSHRFRRLPALVVLAAGLLSASSAQAAVVVQNVPDNTYQIVDLPTGGRVEAILRVGPVVYVGGNFTQVKKWTSSGDNTLIDRHNLFAVNAHTGDLLPWDPSTNGRVRSLAVSPNGTSILIGGDFTTLQPGATGAPVARPHLASVAACSVSGATVNGCANTARAWHPDPDGNVFALAAMGSRVYVGGNFHRIGGAARKNLAAVGLTSGRALAWAGGASDVVRALGVSASGARVFVGGKFTKIGAAALPHLAVLSSITGAPVPWKAHPPYTVLGVTANGSYLYVAGAGGGGHVASYRLSDGGLRWQPPLDGDATQLALHRGKLFIVGHFAHFGGVVHRHLLFLDAKTGLADHSWTTGTNQTLGTFAAFAYGQQVYAGGDFTNIVSPNTAQHGFAQFSDTDPADVTAPTITRAPRPSMLLGSTIGATVPVSLSWAGSDGVAGICRYTVQRKVNGVTANLVPALPKLTSLATAMRANTGYQFLVSATDCADNVTASPTAGSGRIGIFQNSSPAITYSGHWKRTAASGASGGSITYTTQRGAGAALNFTGRQVAWVASRSALRGRASVYVDGHLVKVVDLHAASLARRRVVFVRTFTSTGPHRIKVIARGTAGRPMIDVDAFLVLR
jgi:hypothetical protein